jgi:hypothetical protein
MPGAHPPLPDVLLPPELELLPPELEVLAPLLDVLAPELELLAPLLDVLAPPELEVLPPLLDVLAPPELEVLPPPELEVLPPPELEVLPPPEPEVLPPLLDVEPPPEPEPELPASPPSERSSPMGNAEPLHAASRGSSARAAPSRSNRVERGSRVGMPAYWPAGAGPLSESACRSQTARSRPTSGDAGCASMNAVAALVVPTMQSASARAPSRSCASVPAG